MPIRESAPTAPPPRRRKRRPSLVLTALAALAFVGLVPLLLMGWQVAGSLAPDLEANQKELQLDKALTIEQQVSRFVYGHFDRLESLSAAISHLAAPVARGEQPLDQGRFLAMLEDFVGRQGVLEIALVFPQEGGADRELAVPAPTFDVAAVETDLAPRMAAARERGQRGSRYLSNPFVPAGRPIQALAVIGVPVRAAMSGPDSPRRPVLVAVVSMAPVQQVIEAVGGMREGYRVFVLDDDRRPFAHSEFSKVLAGVPMEPNALVAERLEPSSFSLTYQEQLADGETHEVIGAYHPVEIDDHRWGVFVVVDHDMGLAQVHDMWRTAIRWGLAAFVLAIVIGSVFSWRLTGPIHQLIATTRRIASGEYGLSVNIQSTNEIGMLADHFNVMSGEIRRKVQEINFEKERNHELFYKSISSLAAAIDARDPYTHGHSERVRKYAIEIARQMDLSPQEIDLIEIGALLHDVGKIGIEDRILRKPAALTPEEFEIMKSHPEKGGQIMEPIAVKAANEIIVHHHERWDGMGYPYGLKGDEIPLGARIVNVADTFDAMTTHRPYQKAMTFAVAARKIGDFSGKACDPRVVQAFHAAFAAGRFGAVMSAEAPAPSTHAG